MDHPNLHRVLVVDPDPAIRALIVALLRREGYLTEASPDSQDALERGRSGRHLAVILEPRMPGGEKLLDDLHTASRDGKPNLIVVTSADGKNMPYRDGRGVRTVLLKPFNIEELADAVAKCCDGN
jgi:CheY-like chemotaxis protein